MINPANLISRRWTRPQLEEFLLFAIMTAGKTATTTAKVLDRVLTEARRMAGNHRLSPFAALRPLSETGLATLLRAHGQGCFRQKARTISEVLDRNFNLLTVTVEKLESVWGISWKTSRFFVGCTRQCTQVACLDTHVLRFLRERGIDAPLQTPTSKKVYQALQDVFLSLAAQAGKTPAEFDQEIWLTYSAR